MNKLHRYTTTKIIEDIHQDTGLPYKEIRGVLEIFFERIKSALSYNKIIYLQSFGSFYILQYKSKITQVFKNREKMGKAYDVSRVHFKPCKKLRSMVSSSRKNKVKMHSLSKRDNENIL